MRPSRLRFELALHFGLAMGLALGVLVVALVTNMHHQANGRLIDALDITAHQVAAAIEVEVAEESDLPIRTSALEEMKEFYPGTGVLLAFDARGGLLGSVGEEALVGPIGSRMPLVISRSASTTWELATSDGQSARAVAVRSGSGPDLTVVAARSEEAVIAETRALLAWLAMSIPVIVALSGFGGYVLAARALRPLQDLSGAIEELGPGNLDGRLELRSAGDEVGMLAVQVNALLARLEEAQRRNQTFLASVAHQIKTPLTIVRGETTLALEKERSPKEYIGALRRVVAASEQMSRRVDELLLMAQAEIGMIPAPSEQVELDGLVLECCDLMRVRARNLGGALELGRIESLEATGNQALLSEALLELIENALRHGSAQDPVQVSVFAEADRACLEVASTGAEIPPGPPGHPRREDGSAGGLGLSIVEWIASFHSGTLTVEHREGRNHYRIQWPLRLETPAAPRSPR